MDFITGLPKSKKKNDSNFVVVDKLSKATDFIQVKVAYNVGHTHCRYLLEGDI